MDEVFPNWTEDNNLEIQEVEWIPNRINPKTYHKLLKVKGKEKHFGGSQRETLQVIWKTADFFFFFKSETREARKK